MEWRQLHVGAGELGSASEAGGSMGGRPVGAQGRRLGVDAGSLAISRGEQGPGFGPNSENSNLMHRESPTMHEGFPQLMSPSRFFE